MSAIFLSASVPVPGGGNYYENADPFLIQTAVREFVTTALGRRLIVWGGHPAITPMVWSACEDLGVGFAKAVVLYQSRFFEEMFPEENRRFGNVEYVEAAVGDREESLRLMRTRMLSREDLSTAVFIGGMEGVIAEYELFVKYHSGCKTLAVPSPGGAARELAKRLAPAEMVDVHDLDFARLFHIELGISPKDPRAMST